MKWHPPLALVNTLRGIIGLRIYFNFPHESDAMALNPNITHEVYEGGAYVSVPTDGIARPDAPPMLRSDYKAFEEKFNKLRHDTRAILSKLAWVAPSKQNDPLPGLSAVRRDAVIADLKKHHVGWCRPKTKTFGLDDAARAVVRDLASGKKGFYSPVYNVEGKPVFGEHFDHAGNLSKPIAKALGVSWQRPAQPATATAAPQTAPSRFAVVRTPVLHPLHAAR